jgi:hypothetical protein
MQQAASFTVTSEAIPRLCADLADVEARIRDFAYVQSSGLVMRPLGSDRTSIAAAQIHNENAKKATNALLEYADQLQNIIIALRGQDKAYNATEHTATAPFLNGHR